MAKQKKSSVMQIFVAGIILIAIAAGVFAQLLPRDQLILLINFRDFFEFTLPILAFGAIIKYLSAGRGNCSCGCGPECKCCSTKK